MTIEYNPKTNRYKATDRHNNNYPDGTTMIEAIQHAISINFYWHSINK